MNGPAISVAANIVLGVQLGQNLVQQEARILIRDRVVLDRAHRLVAYRSRRNEQVNHHRDLALLNQVVGHFLDAVETRAQIAIVFGIAAAKANAVLPDHERGGLRSVVLRRHVNPVVGLHALVDLADVNLLLGHRAARHVGLLVGIGRIGGNVVGPADNLAVNDVVKFVGRAGLELADVEPSARRPDAPERARDWRIVDIELRL